MRDAKWKDNVERSRLVWVIYLQTLKVHRNYNDHPLCKLTRDVLERRRSASLGGSEASMLSWPLQKHSLKRQKVWIYNRTSQYWTFSWHHANQTDKSEMTTLLEDLGKDMNFRVKDKKIYEYLKITIEVNYLGIQWAMADHLQIEGHLHLTEASIRKRRTVPAWSLSNTMHLESLSGHINWATLIKLGKASLIVLGSEANNSLYQK